MLESRNVDHSKKLLFGHHSFMSFSELLQLYTHATITKCG